MHVAASCTWLVIVLSGKPEQAHPDDSASSRRICFFGDLVGLVNVCMYDAGELTEVLDECSPEPMHACT